MNASDFHLDASAYGIPTRQELVDLRIWDTHFHGMYSPQPVAQYEQNNFYVERMGIEHSICLDIGIVRSTATQDNSLAETPQEAEIRAILERDKERLSGVTPIEPSHPEGSCAKMEKWIRNGPCIGIKYVAGNRERITCDHPNNDPIIRLAVELEAAIYIHTFTKVGGNPRRFDGATLPGESTPLQVAALARRFPDARMICGHSGGDWELAVRAIRDRPNVFLEFSGSDPHSGSVEYAVRELGVHRIVWGGHGPSRSYATELGKVFDAGLSRADQMKILGGNYREYAAPIFRRKGRKLEL